MPWSTEPKGGDMSGPDVDADAPDPNAGEPASYESARDELLAIVRRLEAGGTSLQESIELWERGEQLAERCQEFLDGARRRIAPVEQGGPATDSSDQTSS
jgi:exodeoxyribonuclease VII small subunit